MTKCRRGDIVAIEFLDHSEGGNAPLLFVVYGRVAVVSRASISVDSWAYTKHKKDADCNMTRFTIVKKAIMSIKRLAEVL